MLIYRPHKGSVCESLDHAKEFETEHDMKEYIVKDWQNHFDYDDIVIQDQIIEETRIGWKNTRMVTVKRMGDQTYPIPQCIGYSATCY